MGFLSVLSFAQRLVEQSAFAGDIAIDATAGNGVDTVFLARRVGATGMVHCFDVQQQALDRTRERIIRETGDCSKIHFHLQSHSKMKETIPSDQHGLVSAVMFNLGYLPGSDQSTITTADCTIPALTAAVHMLKPSGVATVVIYTGHEGGAAEAQAVEQWAATLPQEQYNVIRYQYINRRNHPPYLIAVMKNKQK